MAGIRSLRIAVLLLIIQSSGSYAAARAPRNWPIDSIKEQLDSGFGCDLHNITADPSLMACGPAISPIFLELSVSGRNVRGVEIEFPVDEDRHNAATEILVIRLMKVFLPNTVNVSELRRAMDRARGDVVEINFDRIFCRTNNASRFLRQKDRNFIPGSVGCVGFVKSPNIWNPKGG